MGRGRHTNPLTSKSQIDDLVRMVQAVTLAAEESGDPAASERLFGFVLDGVRAR